MASSPAEKPEKRQSGAGSVLVNSAIWLALAALAIIWWFALGVMPGRLAQARRQDKVVPMLEASGVTVRYDYEYDANLSMTGNARPPGAKWLRRLLGKHFCDTVVFVRVKSHVDDDVLGLLGELPRLKMVSMRGAGVTDEGAAHLRHLTGLRRLNLNDTSVGDEGLKHVAELVNLERLWLSGTRITDDGLGHLKNLRNLEVLEIENVEITDQGIAHLRELPKLVYLRLRKTRVTTDAVQELEKSSPAGMKVEF